MSEQTPPTQGQTAAEHPQPVTPPAAQPLPQYPYGYVPSQPTNTMAILSLVFGFLISILGVIFGFIALGQLKKPEHANEQGKGLAIAGIVIGFVFMVPVCVIVLLTLLGPSIGNIFSDITSSLQ